MRVFSSRSLCYFSRRVCGTHKRDVPEQFMAIVYLENALLSVVYEIRYDDEGEYIWLITYWKSTRREREIYEQYFY
jgi:uncharacterized DUF497 family protein